MEILNLCWTLLVSKSIKVKRYLLILLEIPEGAHLESTVIFVPDDLGKLCASYITNVFSDLPSTIKPAQESGKFHVAFKPIRTGEYMIAANLVDKVK